MGNLDLIITHYKEPWELGKGLFDSIAMQRMVSFEDVGVILVNDGEGNELPSECFDEYPFEVCQMSIPKGGVSKARNAGLDASNADWVMFCDFDDGFSSVFGLYMIFCAIHEDKYDTLWSCFTEETKDVEGNRILVAHDRDWVFIHGKAHRRQYLIDNQIRFNDKLTIHEDAYFTMLTQTFAEEGRIAAIRTPIYVWKWNDNSVVRKDGEEDYILATYDHLMRQRIALTEEFIRRERHDLAIVTATKTVIDSYYDFQQVTWRTDANKERIRKAQNWFAAYLKRYAGYYIKADKALITKIMSASRQNAVNKGAFMVEFETLRDWLDIIMKEAKPIPVWDQGV